MELDLSRLNNLAFVVIDENKQATKPPQKQQEAVGEYKTTKKAQKPLQDDLKGIDGIRVLQRKADQNKAERDHIKEVYRQHQENTIKSNQLQTEILKGVRAGESVYSLFLKASKAITLMTGNTAFYTQIEAEAKTIYGEGLLQKAPLQIELQETEQRLKRLREAQERELSGDSSQRMKNAIKAHEARIAELQELIEKGACNKPRSNTRSFSGLGVQTNPYLFTGCYRAFYRARGGLKVIGKYTPPELITPEEALAIFKYGTLSEMYRAKALYDFYKKSFKPGTDVLWDFIRLLSFVYDTARIQGIREERARRSSRSATNRG